MRRPAKKVVFIVLFLVLLCTVIPGEAHTTDITYIDGIVTATKPWGDWAHYHNYTEIVNTLLYLNNTYPNIVDVFSIGKSWENRDIYCIRLANENLPGSKPKVFFVGYHHARELISAELPLYFAVEAATNYGTNETITDMLNYSEIYIVVALNVDAFDVVWQNEWQRKNVHPFDEDEDDFLDEDLPDDEDGDGYIEDLLWWNGTDWEIVRWEGIDDDGDGLLNEDWIGGVDLNRNYGYQWDATCDSGSLYPSEEDYRGPAPFSEPETQAIRDIALQHDFKYAISFHSGAEIIGYPWGYTTTPTSHDQLFKEVAGNLSDLVNAPFSQAGTWYTTSGVWDDWMYGNRSTFALTCEIYTNESAWQYEPGPDPDTFWEKGVFQFFNPDPDKIEDIIQRWLPVFTNITERAISEAYDIALLREPAKQWNQTYGGTDDDRANSLVQTGDGGYALTGATLSFGAGSYDFWLVKTNSAGNMQWNRTYGGADEDVACSLVQTDDGGYALAGYTGSYGAGSWDFWLVKVDSSGNAVWNQTYGGTSAEYAWSVVQTDDGGYALAGLTTSFGAGSSDIWLVKTDSSGVMQWNQTYGGVASDQAQSVVQTVDGGYALAGSTLSFDAGMQDFWLVKVDSSGNAVWNQTYGGTNNDYGKSVVQTVDGGYALTGRTQSLGAGSLDFWLVKVDSSGNAVWNQTYGGTSYDAAEFLVQTDDGGYALAGYTDSYGGDHDFWLVKVDSSGNAVWNQTYGGTNNDYGKSVVQTVDGGYALAGYAMSLGAGGYDYWLMKIGPSPGVDPRTVYEGQNVNIIVAIKNEGTQAVTFNVTACYNTTAIETKTVTNLAPNAETTLTFIWNTIDVSPDNYTISATATQVPGETDTTDNTLSSGIVWVIVPGDVNRDRIVDIFDIGYISAHWYPGPPTGPLGYDVYADINNDGSVDIFDIGIVSSHWGESW